MDNPFKTNLDMKTGTISICDNNQEGTKRFTMMIDEAPGVIESLQATREKAELVMGNPLLDARGVDVAMTFYSQSPQMSQEFSALVEFYQNTLVMLWRLESDLEETANDVARYDFESKNTGAISVLNVWRDKIAAILEAHKQHMAE